MKPSEQVKALREALGQIQNRIGTSRQMHDAGNILKDVIYNALPAEKVAMMALANSERLIAELEAMEQSALPKPVEVESYESAVRDFVSYKERQLLLGKLSTLRDEVAMAIEGCWLDIPYGNTSVDERRKAKWNALTALYKERRLAEADEVISVIRKAMER